MALRGVYYLTGSDDDPVFDTDIEEGLRKARKEKQLKLTMKIVTYLM